MARRIFRAVRDFKFRLRQNNLVAVLERHDGLFPVGRLAGLQRALTAGLAADVQRVDLGDLDLEQLLHGLADFRLVGAAVGHDGVLVVLFALARAFFGQADGLDDFKSVHVIP